ncbi:hypothetical protein B7767_14875, partial [Streptomyces sp. 13-12-16]
MMWRPHGSSAFQAPARPRRARRAVPDRLARFPAGGGLGGPAGGAGRAGGGRARPGVRRQHRG